MEIQFNSAAATNAVTSNKIASNEVESNEIMKPTQFNYESIPEGFYQDVIETGNPVRRAWHLQKFERVIQSLPSGSGMSILDIGCFAGTFLSRVPESWFSRQVGVDILPNQINYANRRFGSAFREFRAIESVSALGQVEGEFDVVTLIEVIEHLNEAEVAEVMRQAAAKVKPGGHLVLSTPNYTSSWPVVEVLVNFLSEVSYEEQHITKFNYFNCVKKLTRIAPELEKSFRLDFRTTTHFIAPFMAAVSLDAAMWFSRAVPHHRWGNPFGNLILMSFVRT